MNLTRTKTVEQSVADTEESEHQLRKELGPVQLTVFGVGVILGTGIFVLTGEAAGEKAGPAIALSFVFSGIACALAALCYAEFASTVPVAGSAYTFSYASLGEIVAWIIGWDLILELALGASTVAVGWSSYFADVMKGIGITIPGLRVRRRAQSGCRGDRADPHRRALRGNQDLLAGQLRLRGHQGRHRAAGDRGRACSSSR